MCFPMQMDFSGQKRKVGMVLLTSASSCLSLLTGCEKRTPDIAVSTAAPQTQTDTTAIDGGSFLVANIRSNGELVPWAEYRDGKWQIDIPPQNEPSEFVPDDRSLADRTSPWFEGKGPLNKWYYSAPSGKMTLIKASETARKFDSHCQNVWGLEADFRKKPNRDGFYESGVALNVEKKLVKMVDLSSKSKSVDSIYGYLSHDKDLRLAFEELEATAIVEQGLFHVFQDLKAQNKTEPVLTTLVGTPVRINGYNIYYFEFRTTYRKPQSSKDAQCNRFNVYQGWIVEDAESQKTLLNADVILTNCDFKELNGIFPEAVLPLDNRIYLVATGAGYEDTHFIILEATKTEIKPVVEIGAGGC